MIEWLTDTLLMTGVLMALVLLTRRAVGHWFGAGAAYALWALPMIRLVLPPLALPRVLLPQYHFGIEKITASASVPVEAVVAPTVTAVTVPSLVSSKVMPDAIVAPGLLAQIPWTTLLLSVWLAGAALFLIWRVASYQAMRRQLLRGACQVARSGEVRIIESPAATAPLAFGVLDKVIALPVGFLATVDSETSDLAIAHELEHHAGSDLLALMAMQPLFAMHWFNPLGWAAWRALRSDQEAACDARVMMGRGGEQKALYGRLIASFAGGERLALIAPMAGPLSGSKPIIHRLRALARKDVGTARRVLGRSLFALAVIAVPVTATVSHAAIEGDGAQAADRPPAPAGPTVPTVVQRSTSVADAPDVPAAPAAPDVPEASDPVHAEPAAPQVTAPPVPPVQPVAGMRPYTVHHEAHAIHDAEAARGKAEQARRMAEQAIARAPKVEETVTADGRKIVRITRKNEQGRSEVTQEMVIDDRCPADTNGRVASSGTHGAQVVICTGVPMRARSAEVDALRAARRSAELNRHLDAQVRAEILADLDGEIADASDRSAD